MSDRFEVQIPPHHQQAFREARLWPDRRLTEYLDDAVARDAMAPAVIGYDSRFDAPIRLSYGELDRMVTRIALGLAGHGIGPGDVVAAQLPNLWQFTALHLACVRIGAVTNPLMPIFRHRELTFMLSFGEAKAIVVPRLFRNFDHPAMIADIRGEVPSLEHVFVIGGEGDDSFEARLVDRAWEDEADAAALFAERQPDPDAVTILMYTSGTTGQPKGVMHTHNTLISNIVGYVEGVGLGDGETILMASPLAHLTGFLYGLMMPVFLGRPGVLMDIWDPMKAADIIGDEAVTFTMAATPFLSDLTGVAESGHGDLSSLHAFLTAGAPIPRVLVQRATEHLGARIISCWGMTENGGVTLTGKDDPPEKVFETDGAAMTGMETRVVDDAGQPVPPDVEGHLQVRGMCSFAGYLKKPELYGTDADGWFATGDIARMDADGYIRIVGRGKDIIIRGGENVPVIEVEEILYRHPAVQDAAIVAMPDDRLGERACVFVTFKDGQTMTFDDMVAYLLEQKMTKTYLPEHLEVVDEMPRTPSGKIQKFKLREMAEALAADQA